MRWFEGWLRRLSEKYGQPVAMLEAMPPAALHREIAILYGEAVKDMATWLTEKVDSKERGARQKEWKRVEASADWFDKLVVEKVRSSAT